MYKSTGHFVRELRSSSTSQRHQAVLLHGLDDDLFICLRSPEGPSTQYLRTLVPETIKGIVSAGQSPEIMGTWTL